MHSLSGTILSRWAPGITDIVIGYLPMEDLLAKSEQEIERHTWNEIEEVFRDIFYPKSQYTLENLLVKRRKDRDVLFKEKVLKHLYLTLNTGSLDQIQRIYRIIVTSTSLAPSPQPIASSWNREGTAYPDQECTLIFTKKAISNLAVQANKLKELCGHLVKYSKEIGLQNISEINSIIDSHLMDHLLITQHKKRTSEKLSLKDGEFQDLTHRLFRFMLKLTPKEFEAIKEKILRKRDPNLDEMLELTNAAKLTIELKNKIDTEGLDTEELDTEELDTKGLDIEEKLGIMIEQIFEISSPVFIEFMVLEINQYTFHLFETEDINERWIFLGLCFEHPKCPPECRGRILEHIISNTDREEYKIDTFFSSKLQTQDMPITGSFTGEQKPLHVVASSDLDETAQEILKRKNEEINYQDKDGDTALHIAANLLAYNVMGQLIDHSADVNIQNNQGSTPLIELLRDTQDKHLVDSYDEIPPLVTKLLSKGAKPNHALSIEKKTALHFAVRLDLGHEIIPTLLEWGANPNLLDMDGASPLIYAIQEMVDSKDEKATMALLDSEEIDVNKGKDEEGNTPLHLAIHYSSAVEDDFNRIMDVIDELLLLGADIYAKNKAHETPLDLAEEDEDFQKRLVKGYNKFHEVANGESEDIPKVKNKPKKRKKSTHSVTKKKFKAPV